MNSTIDVLPRPTPMGDNSISDGFLPIPEGALYWRFDVANAESQRPTVLLIHAAVADHTMWDAQVESLLSQGWNCLRFDLLGFGKSWPSDLYLRSQSREPFDPMVYVHQLLQTILGPESKVIIIGLSIGASMALAFSLAHSERVVGLVLAAGGLRGFEHDNEPQEEALFDKAESLIGVGDVHGAANLMVRIWGDGPMQEPGRIAEDVGDRMLKWNIDISARECAKTGGMALDAVQQDPPPIARLHTIDVPTAIAFGTYDESYTTEAMKYVASKVKAATSKEFTTAHMINLEQPDEFNRWLSEWLEESFGT